MVTPDTDWFLISSTSNNDLSKGLQQNACERDEKAQIARLISEWEFIERGTCRR